MSENKNTSEFDSDISRQVSVRLQHGGAAIVVRNGEETTSDKISVDPAIVDDSKILEEIVYSRPGLLNETGCIDIIVNSKRFAVIPAEIADNADLLHATANAIWPDIGLETLIVNPTAAGVAVIHIPADDIAGYTERTFANSSVTHRIAALIDTCSRQSRPVKDVKMYINFLPDGKIDIASFGADLLLMANTFDCHGNDDELYFIMAAAKDCRLDQVDDEIVVFGDTDAHQDTIERLKLYFNSVATSHIIL